MIAILLSDTSLGFFSFVHPLSFLHNIYTILAKTQLITIKRILIISAKYNDHAALCIPDINRTLLHHITMGNNVKTVPW